MKRARIHRSLPVPAGQRLTEVYRDLIGGGHAMRLPNPHALTDLDTKTDGFTQWP